MLFPLLELDGGIQMLALDLSFLCIDLKTLTTNNDISAGKTTLRYTKQRGAITDT